MKTAKELTCITQQVPAIAPHFQVELLGFGLAAAIIIGAVIAMVSGRPRDVEDARAAPETADAG